MKTFFLISQIFAIIFVLELISNFIRKKSFKRIFIYKDDYQIYRKVYLIVALIGIGLTIIDLTAYRDEVYGSVFELDSYDTQYSAFIGKADESEFQEVVANISFDFERSEYGTYRLINLVSIKFPDGKEIYYDDEFNENKLELGKKVNLSLYDEITNDYIDYEVVISEKL